MGLTSGGGEWSGEETSCDWDWLMTLLGRAGMSIKGTVAGGVSKTVGGLRAGGVSGRPWLGNERRGGVYGYEGVVGWSGTRQQRWRCEF